VLELNLMPKDLQAPQRKTKASSVDFKLPKIAPIPVIIGIISIMIASQLILGLVAFRQKRTLSSIGKTASEIISQKNMALVLKKEADELSGRFAVIEGLMQGSLVWSKKLYDLSNSMIDGIWLTSLSLNIESPKGARLQPGNDADRQTMVITGMAVASGDREETAVVGRFIDSLKGNEDFFRDFDDIKLSSIQRENYGNAEAMSFSIVCYFKQDRSYFERLQS
jgi:hypothetical protein